MKRNRFEQVDELQPDAINLTLSKREGEVYGIIVCPPDLTGGRLPEGVASPELGGIEAFRSAIKLANEMRAPIVVVDPDGAWISEWGDLYRAE
jgi:hypothetical protein